MSRKLSMAAVAIMSVASSAMTLSRMVSPAANYKGVPHGKGQRKANKANRWK